MSKPEWGTKRVCQNCSAVYYDMRKAPPTCPQCATKFDPEALLRSRRGRTMPVDDTTANKPVADVAPELAVLEDDAVVEDIPDEDEEEGDALLEDASELGEDEDVGVPVVPGED